MKIVIATSRAFHLTHLARELSMLGHAVTLFGYVPKWRMRQYGLGQARYIDLFAPMLPRSALALQRPLSSVCRAETLKIMAPYDRVVASQLPSCDVFIGLSGVIVEAFGAARERFNAVTLCERGSAHVRTQAELIDTGGNQHVPGELFARELAGYEVADVTVVPSHFAEQSFIAHGHPKDRLFRNMYGVNRLRFPRASKKTMQRARCRVLFVGGWSFQKGCDLFTDALELMPELEIVHVGKQVDLPFPSSPRFRSLGYVDNARLYEAYREYDILALPSRQDGFGMVLLEAFASGLPIVASTNTGAADIRAVINDKSRVRIMREYSPQALVSEFLTLREEEREGGARDVSDNDIDALTWGAYARRYDTFLRNVLDRRKHGVAI